MAAPWLKYQSAASPPPNAVAAPAGPWSKYSAAATPAGTKDDSYTPGSVAADGTVTPPKIVIRGATPILPPSPPAPAATVAQPPESGAVHAWNGVVDPINAGLSSFVQQIPVVGPALSGVGNNVDAAVNRVVGAEAQTPEAVAAEYAKDREDNPVASTIGGVAGTVLPLAAVGGVVPGAAKVLGMEGSIPTRMLMGAASGGAIGGADTIARGGSPTDALKNAAIDGAVGGALPGLFGAAGKLAKLAVRPRANIPLDTLEAAKNGAYSRADQLGVRYSPTGYDNLVNNLSKLANDDHISQARHPKAFSMLNDLATEPAGTAPTLTELDQIRQVVRRDVGVGDDAEGHFGRQMIDGIDHFIENAQPTDLTQGSASVASLAIKAARRANAIYRKVQQLDDLLEKATRQVASTGSGGNINNAVRQGLKRILETPAKAAGYTAEEKAAMEAIVRGSKAENAARLVGKLSPQGNGLMTALSIGGAAAIPALAAAPAAGTVAKYFADNATLMKLAALRDAVARSGAADMPLISKNARRALVAPASMALLNNSPRPVAQGDTLAALSAQ